MDFYGADIIPLQHTLQGFYLDRLAEDLLPDPLIKSRPAAAVFDRQPRLSPHGIPHPGAVAVELALLLGVLLLKIVPDEAAFGDLGGQDGLPLPPPGQAPAPFDDGPHQPLFQLEAIPQEALEFFPQH